MHEWWNDFSSQLRKNDFLQKESEKIAKRLIDNPDLIKFLTPEGKGRLIASLCHSSWLSREEHQEAAILEVMKTVEKKAEYAKICKNVHITYHKTSGEGDVSRAASTKVKGERIIYDLMDWGAESTFTSMVKRLED
jgi:putative intracellular protease/amidase